MRAIAAITILFINLHGGALPASAEELPATAAAISTEGEAPSPTLTIPEEAIELISQSEECLAELNYSCAKLAYELALEKFIRMRDELEEEEAKKLKPQLDCFQASLTFSLGITLAFLDIEPQSSQKLEEAFTLDPKVQYDAEIYSPALRQKIAAAKKKAEDKLAIIEKFERAKEESRMALKTPVAEIPSTGTGVSEPAEPSPSALKHTLFFGGGGPLMFGKDAEFFSRGFLMRAGYKFDIEYGFHTGAEFSFAWLSARNGGALYMPALSATGGYIYKWQALEIGGTANVGYAVLNTNAGGGDTTGTMLLGVRGQFGGRYPDWLYYGLSLGPQWYLFRNAYSFVLGTQLELGFSF